ncbi:MAG TPA: hypothetical protein VFT19_03095, partial [Solirubrobacterales bacterium]|nr:hypothetical protein [Solirubrobacterales bacterium]
MWSIGDPGGVGDSAYADGLRAAVPVAIEYGLAAIGHGETHESPVPSELLLQARHAARSSVGLDTVLRRYFAGYTLLADALVSEVGAVLRGDEVERLLGRLALRADRLLAAVGAEYTSERESRPGTAEQRLGEQLACLLAGEQVSPALLDYRFDDF